MAYKKETVNILFIKFLNVTWIRVSSSTEKVPQTIKGYATLDMSTGITYFSISTA